MFKKCFLMTALCLSVMVLSPSCNKPDKPKEPETIPDKIELESRNLTCSPNAETLTTTVTTANGITKVESSSDWCKVSFSGTTVTLEVAENGAALSRDATITIVSGTESASIALNQDGVTFDFPLSGKAISTNDVAKDTVVAFTSNANFVFSSSVDWASAAQSDDGLKISLQENTTGTIRTGKVYMTFGELKDSVYVTQSDFVGTYGKSLYFYYGFETDPMNTQRVGVTLSNDKMTIEKFGEEGIWFEGPFSFPIKIKGDEEGHYVATIESGSFLGYITEYEDLGLSFFLIFVDADWTQYWGGQAMDIVFTKEKDANGEEILIGRFSRTIYETRDPSIVYGLNSFYGAGMAFMLSSGETGWPDSWMGQGYAGWVPLITSKELSDEEVWEILGFE